jgi:hypothetical protein
MADGNFTDPKMQARFIDEAISDLNLKLAYPGSIFRPSRILHTEQTLEKYMSENEEVLVNGYHVILKSVICHIPLETICMLSDHSPRQQ